LDIFSVKLSRLIFLFLLITAFAVIAWQAYTHFHSKNESKQVKDDKNRPVPVVTEPIVKTSISQIRHFNGTLESYAEFYASPKVGGIIESISFNLGDAVSRGQIVATLDNAEFDQMVKQANAAVAVASANLHEARSLLKIAERELKRIDKLSERGVSSASQRDAAQADQLAKQAHVQVTIAELTHAQAQLETARIRRDYTNVTADWHGDDSERLVAERFVDEGETVDANTPILKIVTLNPITAVFHVTEKEYAGLSAGQQVSVTTDAYPEQRFSGLVKRIAPIFSETTRQARIEVQIDNLDKRLKPGMFVRAEVVLRKLDEAIVIPLQALTRRDDMEGVFILSEDGSKVTWQRVATGIRQGDRLQILDEELQGRVVTLGQQLLKDGSTVILPDLKKTK
jgi:RND family efflux transporter MFP subunit